MLDAILAALTREFETKTGRRPFLSTGSNTVRYFDPPDGRSGRLLLSIDAYDVDEVRTGYSSSSAGTVLTEGTDYVLGPVEKASEEPYAWIEFLTSPGYLRGSVKVTAKFGRETVPDDAWLAMCNQAAVMALMRSQNPAGVLTKVKQGDLEYTWGGNSNKSLFEQWGDEWRSVIGRYVYVPVE